MWWLLMIHAWDVLCDDDNVAVLIAILFVTEWFTDYLVYKLSRVNQSCFDSEECLEGQGRYSWVY